MKLYRLHYGDDIKQGIYRGNTGKYGLYAEDIPSHMELEDEFNTIMIEDLHSPRLGEFISFPSDNSLFYFKESFFKAFEYLIDDFIATANELGSIVNITIIDLNEIQSYNCLYQDENQMCIEIN